MNNPRLCPRILHIALLIATMFVGSPAAVEAAPPVGFSAAAGLPLADSFSWYGFVRYWRSFANRADHVVLVVVLVMAAALFIITRGKWLK